MNRRSALGALGLCAIATFAGTHGNGRDAPISDVRESETEPRGSTLTCHSPTQPSGAPALGNSTTCSIKRSALFLHLL